MNLRDLLTIHQDPITPRFYGKDIGQIEDFS